jgi:hypothetical protein
MGFFAVPVTGDWTTPANCWADIQTATGMASPETEDYTHVLLICLWEGEEDPTDYATLSVVNNVASYTSLDELYTPFMSPPSSGTAYIIGVAHHKISGGSVAS